MLRGACFEHFRVAVRRERRRVSTSFFNMRPTFETVAVEALLPQQRRELVFAPHRIGFAQAFDGERELWIGLGLAHGVGACRLWRSLLVPAEERGAGLTDQRRRQPGQSADALAATSEQVVSPRRFECLSSRRGDDDKPRYMTRCRPRICRGVLRLPDPSHGELIRPARICV